MNNTYPYLSLKKNVTSLLTQLPRYNISGNYNVTHISDYRKVVLLQFAEIEYFIESLCEDVISVSLDKYTQSRSIDSYLASLLYKSDFRIEVRRKQTINTYVHNVVAQYKSGCIGLNHGIDIDHMTKLFGMIGIEHLIQESFIGMLFVNEINTFSSERGFFAHNSQDNPQTKSKVQPRQLRSRIKIILDGLKRISENI